MIAIQIGGYFSIKIKNKIILLQNILYIWLISKLYPVSNFNLLIIFVRQMEFQCLIKKGYQCIIYFTLKSYLYLLRNSKQKILSDVQK
ncbi:hypothetical protein pb186bvf_013271 [Paramecium bursaria]